jgi:putative flippase GtrA
LTGHAGTVRLPAALPAFARFCAVGATNTAITLAAFWLLERVGTPYQVASALAFAAGVANSYLLNGRWTFRARGSFPRYVAVQLSALALDVACVSGAVELLGMSHLLAQLLAMPPVSVATFVLASRFVFGQSALLRHPGASVPPRAAFADRRARGGRRPRLGRPRLGGTRGAAEPDGRPGPVREPGAGWPRAAPDRPGAAPGGTPARPAGGAARAAPAARGRVLGRGLDR